MNKMAPSYKQHPRVTNRGVQNTTPLPPLESLVDWCAFTVSEEFGLYSILDIMNLSLDDFVTMPKGGMGYKTQQRCGNIVLFSEGQENMGYHIEMSGQGCRQFDSSSGRWQTLFARVIGVKGHFTRIDLAIDDRSGLLPLSQLDNKIKRRELRSRFKSGRVTTSYDFVDEVSKDGKTFYFGSVTSDTQIRIYDKAAEQGEDGTWVRAEVQTRHKRAEVLASFLAQTNKVGEIAAGVISNYIAFVEPSQDTNKARWQVCSWWETFIGKVKRLKLSLKKPEKTLQDVKEWIERQTAPSFAMLFKFFGGDYEFFEKLVVEGERRLKAHHLAMLAHG